jgi:hypothetical protein
MLHSIKKLGAIDVSILINYTVTVGFFHLHERTEDDWKRNNKNEREKDGKMEREHLARKAWKARNERKKRID